MGESAEVRELEGDRLRVIGIARFLYEIVVPTGASRAFGSLGFLHPGFSTVMQIVLRPLALEIGAVSVSSENQPGLAESHGCQRLDLPSFVLF